MVEVVQLEPAALVSAAAAKIGVILANACADGSDNRIGFMVSGGHTPTKILPRVLARSDVDWDRIDVVASDERLVPANDPASTETLIRNLFEKAGRPCHYVSFGADTTPKAALTHWRNGIDAMAWPPAVAFLGMGEDAHTASLFPERREATDSNLFAASVPETPPHVAPRLTMGPAALSQCGAIILIANSIGKIIQLEQALQDLSNTNERPVAWLLGLSQTTVFRI